jgi:hypothetical protein
LEIQSNQSKPNPFGTEEFVQFRQVFGLNRYELHRHLVDAMDAINFILELKRREIKMDIGESQGVFLSPVQG